MQADIKLTVIVTVQFDKPPTDAELASVANDLGNQMVGAMRSDEQVIRDALTHEGTNLYKVKGAYLERLR